MNKGMFGFPERFRDESFHGFPKKKVSGESFFGFPSGSEDYDFKCDANTSNFSFAITIISTVGARVVIDKGDGSQIVDIGTGIDKVISWTYSQVGKYNILINGETDKIKKLRVDSRRLMGNLNQKLVDKIPNIEYFWLTNMFVSGTLPTFENCLNLKYFGLQSNLFSGMLPSFANCVNLETFIILGNNFSGDLPSFESCASLKIFNCETNKFSGNLPSFVSCTQLIDFKCSSNLFSGNLPTFNGLTNLVTFNCSNCSFSGNLPSFIDCIQLNSFICRTNILLSGNLPTFNGLTNLVTFDCANNQFSGDIPTFSGCTSLETFSAGGVLMAWTGTVPYFPPSLKVLNLSSPSLSNITIVYDLLDNLINLTTVYLTNFNETSTKTVPNISNNINLQYLHFRYLENSSPFNNGVLNWNTLGLATYFGRSMNGVIHNFTNLNSLSKNISNWMSDNCNYNVPYPLGSNIIAGFNYLNNNQLSVINIDTTINNLFNGRLNYGVNAKELQIAGNNATPSGIYQQPAGFNHDLNEAQIDALTTTVKEKIWILVNCQVSSADTTKRYKWTITTN